MNKINSNPANAERWKRFVAFALDKIIFIVIVLAFLFLFSEFFAIITMLSGLFYQIYLVIFHYKYGATLGKMMLNIKIINLEGNNINFKQAFLRSSVPIVISLLAMPPIAHLFPIKLYYLLTISWYLLDLFIFFIDKERRALHDFIAGTIVVNKI
jgi:uncharacterized RDD family membrane protein YckC